MDMIVIVLSAVNILLALLLVVSVMRARGKHNGGSFDEVKAVIEAMERNNDGFRREVSAYLEKTMNQSLSSAKDLYSALDGQSRMLSERLERMNERLSASLMDVKLNEKKEMETFSAAVREEIEKVRVDNEKSKQK